LAKSIQEQMKYELMEHTADIGIRVYGRTRAELYSHAAEGMFDIICEKSDIKGSQSVKLDIEGVDAEHLMVRWLSELLNYFREDWVFNKFEITDINEKKIKAACYGEKRNQPIQPKAEIKLVTYHGLKIEKVEGGYRVEVIFDV
jgi:SHS2 domain-containing protein